VRLGKPIRVGLLSLLLGVATTYGVASCFMRRVADQGAPMFMFSLPREFGWVQEVFEERGITLTYSEGSNPSSHRIWTFSPGPKCPGWSAAKRMSPDEVEQISGYGNPGGSMCLYERASGWPALAVVERQCGPVLRFVPRGRPQFVSVSGCDFTVRWNQQRGLPWSGRAIAFIPVWPGFAIDAALYGAVWAAAILGVGHLVRLGRCRAGHCENCRYDLTGITTTICPECGTATGSEAAA
jgi:hypothetical protein